MKTPSSQFETSLLVAFVSLTLAACNGFQASHETQKSTRGTTNGGFDTTGNGGGGTGTGGATLNLDSLGLAIAHIFESFASSFPGISEIAACQTVNACADGTPSSQSLTSNCSGSGNSAIGNITLMFNAPQCSLLNSTMVTFIPNMTFTSSGQTMNLSANEHTDYTGQSVGGGIQFGYSISSFSGTMNYSGLRFTGSGLANMDYSVRTTSPMSGQFDILNLAINISGGALQLRDNLAQFTASVQPSNLHFESTCACPLSGSANGTLSGSVTGAISVTFGSTCGSITLQAGGTTHTVQVPGCSVTF